MSNSNFWSYWIFIIGFGLVFTFFIYALISGIEKTEISECKIWAQEAKEYRNYFITKYQDAQCKNYGIEIIAPIK